MSPLPSISVEQATLHGHQVTYRTAGAGPPLVLLHGITGNSAQWEGVMPTLAAHHTVIAPDLLGHGESAKPRGDYSLGAYASAVRDLLALLGHDHATIVGHSLGGGVAMVFAYQFPERVDRMALVSSGGLGREVNLLLRAATLPGASVVLPLMCAEPVRQVVGAVAGAFRKIGLRPASDLAEIAKSFASLQDLETRQAFIHTASGIIDMGGQRVNAHDRLYLAAGVPTLIVWGEGDRMIPASHGRHTASVVPGSRLEIFPGAGHFPFIDEPVRFTDVLLDFIATTEPADIDPEDVRELIRTGAPA